MPEIINPQLKKKAERQPKPARVLDLRAVMEKRKMAEASKPRSSQNTAAADKTDNSGAEGKKLSPAQTNGKNIFSGIRSWLISSIAKGKNTKRTRIIIILMIIFTIALTIAWHERQQRLARELKLMADLERQSTPLVNCLAGPFRQELARGQEIAIDVLSKPPGVNEDFRLKSGSVPQGVTARLEPGKSGSQRLVLAAGAGASPGSYNLTLVYEPRPGAGYERPRYCQYNLILK